jgi:hypothetical protein
MLMVIFGAGASYDSDYRRNPSTVAQEVRLPLAKDLFHEAYGAHAAKYPNCVPLLKRLRDAPTVEPELENIRDESETYRYLKPQLFALRYYLRDVIADAEHRWVTHQPDEQTNYIMFLEALEKWRVDAGERVVLVTFNYDTMLDKALEAVSAFRFREINDLVAHPQYELYKLHGSVDWGRRYDLPSGSVVPGNNDERDQMLIQRALDAVPVDDFRFREQSRATGHFLGPAVSIPVATKSDSDFECPVTHIERLKQSLPRVTRILVVGWRGQEAHFYRLWAECMVGAEAHEVETVDVVDTSEEAAAGAADRVQEGIAAVRSSLRPWGGGFSRFVNDGFQRYLKEVGTTTDH